LNELIQVFIHHHAPLGHVVSPEASFELILGDGLNIGVGVAVSLPLVCCSSKQLVHHEKHLFTVGTLGYFQLLLD
jgi:hypothetical protein